MPYPSARALSVAQYLDERRRTPRLQLLGELHCEVRPHRELLSVRDLSMGGFALDATEPFEVGSVHDVKFLVNDSRAVHLAARVIHSNDFSSAGHSWFVIGFEFVDTTTKGRKEVGQLIDLLTSVLNF